MAEPELWMTSEVGRYDGHAVVFDRPGEFIKLRRLRLREMAARMAPLLEALVPIDHERALPAAENLLLAALGEDTT